MEQKTINTIETDFKAEVIALGLTEVGIEDDKVLIVRRKGDKRNVSKDVDKITTQYADIDMTEYLYVNTTRESIYNSLPEGLFHQPSVSHQGKEDIIREIKTQKKEEILARRFFQPFEMALDKMLSEIQAHEQKYDKAHINNNLINTLTEQWNILNFMHTEQALLFIKTIPVLSEVSRNMDMTAKVLSMILDCQISIKEAGKSEMKITSIKLRNWKLGINSVLGTSTKSESTDLIIQVGPINSNEMKLFKKDQKNDRILKELTNMIIPFNRKVIFKYQMSDNKFHLSGKKHKVYLGINTTL